MDKIHSEEFREIAARVEAVERENRRLKKIALSVLALAGAVLLMGQARPNRTIEAERFILKDASGKIRARLDMSADRPTLALLNEGGYPMISLAAGDSPGLEICEEAPTDLRPGTWVTCNQQIQVGRFGKEQFGIALYLGTEGPFGGARAGLSVRNDMPGLDLWNKDATETVSLNLDSGPSLRLSGKEGKLLVHPVGTQP